ncbi:MAG: S-layer homology domain-containing protein [Clostridia bacterium]|nr:S-layer homology domain-containing protein [Clostridia bacterium]
MKNYLKKAISAVIALALAASIVPASFAANVVLTDVADTADYATAVKTLVALKVVNGYEDNTFLPDNKITRAEASKIIVAALNETASAEAMKGATKFSDIAAKHEWATGYINKGVSMGYINGMENNTFQPDGNVTYAQIIKMMLCAMGYEDYAASLAEQYNYTGANWYIPYTQLAADAGITDGVYAAPNEAVTRAQVAQLVYNAIKAPVVKNVGVSYTDSGKIVPKIQIQDGVQSTYFKSILTEKFDAYYVEGYVMDTYKTNPANLEADEVKFGIAKSNKYDNESVELATPVRDMASVTVTLDAVNVGDTDAANNINVYASAIVMVNEEDEWSFISFTPSGKNKTVELDAALLTTGTGTNVLWFWTDDTQKKSVDYKLYATADVYVNGFNAGKINDDADGEGAGTETVLEKYVTSLDNGKITLVDTYKTDGEYDKIYVNAYARDMVTAISGDEIIMTATTLDLDKEANEDLEYHIYYNGEEIAISDLKEDDVLSIAYDIKGDVDDSNYYEIYVSRDTVTGTLKRKPDMAATIDDTKYEFVTEGEYLAFDANLGDKVTLYLDYFGDIYDWEVDVTSVNWGIADKFRLGSSDDEYKLTIFTAEGTTKSYFFDSKNGVVKVDGTAIEVGAGKTYTSYNAALTALVYAEGSTKNAIEDRVIQYKVKASTGKLSEVNFITAATGNGDTATAYDAARSKIGAIRLSAATKIVDACEWADDVLSIATIDSLVNKVEYVSYAYGDKINNAYPFVVVTAGEAPYTLDTRFAVVTEDGAVPVLVEDEEGFFEIEVLYGENDVTTLIATDDDETELKALKAGDVIFFTTNAAGQVEDIDVIFHFAAGIPSYADLATASLANGNEDNNVSGITITSTGDNFGTGVFTQDWDAAATDKVKLVYGPIAEVSKNSISFAKVVDGETDLVADVQEYDIAPEINVYKYDFGSTAKFKFSATTKTTGAAIQPSRFLTKLIQENDDVIDWDDATAKHNEKANFAFALVVEDEVVDIFEFIAG